MADVQAASVPNATPTPTLTVNSEPDTGNRSGTEDIRGGEGERQGHGDVTKGDDIAEPGMGILMGLFSAGRGIGAVVSGPVSEILLKRGGWEGGVAGYGGLYGGVIVWTGVSAFAGLVW